MLRSVERLAARGFTVTSVAPGPDGRVRVEDFVAAVKPETALCAVMLVNNELGTLQPVARIAGALRAAGFRGQIHCEHHRGRGGPLDLALRGR